MWRRPNCDNSASSTSSEDSVQQQVARLCEGLADRETNLIVRICRGHFAAKYRKCEDFLRSFDENSLSTETSCGGEDGRGPGEDGRWISDRQLYELRPEMLPAKHRDLLNFYRSEARQLAEAFPRDEGLRFLLRIVGNAQLSASAGGSGQASVGVVQAASSATATRRAFLGAATFQPDSDDKEAKMSSAREQLLSLTQQFVVLAGTLPSLPQRLHEKLFTSDEEVRRFLSFGGGAAAKNTSDQMAELLIKLADTHRALFREKFLLFQDVVLAEDDVNDNDVKDDDVTEWEQRSFPQLALLGDAVELWQLFHHLLRSSSYRNAAAVVQVSSTSLAAHDTARASTCVVEGRGASRANKVRKIVQDRPSAGTSITSSAEDSLWRALFAQILARAPLDSEAFREALGLATVSASALAELAVFEDRNWKLASSKKKESNPRQPHEDLLSVRCLLIHGTRLAILGYQNVSARDDDAAATAMAQIDSAYGVYHSALLEMFRAGYKTADKMAAAAGITAAQVVAELLGTLLARITKGAASFGVLYLANSVIELNGRAKRVVSSVGDTFFSAQSGQNGEQESATLAQTGSSPVGVERVF